MDRSRQRARYWPAASRYKAGRARQSTPGGRVKAQASRAPAIIRTDAGRPEPMMARAMRRLRRMWPRPVVSCEYRAIRHLRGGTAPLDGLARAGSAGLTGAAGIG